MQSGSCMADAGVKLCLLEGNHRLGQCMHVRSLPTCRASRSLACSAAQTSCRPFCRQPIQFQLQQVILLPKISAPCMTLQNPLKSWALCLMAHEQPSLTLGSGLLIELCRTGQQGSLDGGGRRQRSASPPATSTTSASANGSSAHLQEVRTLQSNTHWQPACLGMCCRCNCRLQVRSFVTVPRMCGSMPMLLDGMRSPAAPHLQARGRAAEMREGAARLRQCVERGQAAEAEGWAECCTEWRKDIRVRCRLGSVSSLPWSFAFLHMQQG